MIALDSLASSAVSISPAGDDQDNMKDAPQHEVAVPVVDQRRNAPVWIVLCVFCALLLLLAEVEVLGLV